MWLFGKRNAPDPHDPEEALLHRIVRLDGEITDATARVAIAQLLFLQHQDARQPVTLRVVSPGGGLAAGMAVVDTVRELRPTVRTRAPTMAHGIALVVLASGRKGERAVCSTAELSLTPIKNAVGRRRTRAASGTNSPESSQSYAASIRKQSPRICWLAVT